MSVLKGIQEIKALGIEEFYVCKIAQLTLIDS